MVEVSESGVTVAAEVKVMQPGAKEYRWLLEVEKGKEEIIP